MLSNRPYLIRAFYEWIIDSNCTPILVIDACHPQCKIPRDYVEDDEIIFNISASAVRDLKITNDIIEFKAAFSGVIHIISVPIKAILALYAEENNEGIFFDSEDGDLKDGDLNQQDITLSDLPTPVTSKPKDKPFLKLVE